MKIFCIFAAVFVVAQAVSFYEVVQEQWGAFKLTHRKEYENYTEEKFRMKIYMDNMRKIAVHNQNYEKGMVSYKLDMNQYGDMLHHEFVHAVNGFNKSDHFASYKYVGDKYGYDGVKFIAPANVKLPESVDWRTLGAVTPIKNQGHCGSCWSFSATGALEGQHFRKTKTLVSLSEQNLVDCSEKYGNNGCEGGLMDNAFRYIKDNHGIDTEISYPYQAVDGKCHYNPSTSGATDRGYVDIESGSEEALKAAVATIGPISVAIDASHESFQFYSNGIYNEPECDSEQLDHGVLAVGYGTTDKGEDYWLVKNSWGTTWGDAGYIKMTRNKENQCGIASQASYPLV